MSEIIGKKYDGDKKRWDLLPLDEVSEVVTVLTEGAKKYDAYNWRHVKPFFERYFAATMRHLEARKAGEVYDEDGKTHLAHAATNIIFLMYGDKKKVDLYDKRIGLDIDEVLSDFADYFIKYYNVDKSKVNRSSYGLFYGFDELYKKSWEDKDFWMSIPVLTNPKDLFFEPKAYITTRKIPIEWTQEWLAKSGFPIAKVIQTDEKGKAAVEEKLDIFVDDHFTNFVDINNNGIKCYLFDRPHNRQFIVGELRLSSLLDILWQ